MFVATSSEFKTWITRADDRFFDHVVEFPSLSVVVESGEVEVVAVEVQGDAEVVAGNIELDVVAGVPQVENPLVIVFPLPPKNKKELLPQIIGRKRLLPQFMRISR